MYMEIYSSWYVHSLSLPNKTDSNHLWVDLKSRRNLQWYVNCWDRSTTFPLKWNFVQSCFKSANRKMCLSSNHSPPDALNTHCTVHNRVKPIPWRPRRDPGHQDIKSHRCEVTSMFRQKEPTVQPMYEFPWLSLSEHLSTELSVCVLCIEREGSFSIIDLILLTASSVQKPSDSPGHIVLSGTRSTYLIFLKHKNKVLNWKFQ